MRTSEKANQIGCSITGRVMSALVKVLVFKSIVAIKLLRATIVGETMKQSVKSQSYERTCTKVLMFKSIDALKLLRATIDKVLIIKI